MRENVRRAIEEQRDAKRKGEAKRVLQDELKQHQANIAATGSEKELADYIAAQNAKQAAYDAMELAKSKAQGKANEVAQKRAAKAVENFEKVRRAFVEKYH